jgi:hypothetical protein
MTLSDLVPQAPEQARSLARNVLEQHHAHGLSEPRWSLVDNLDCPPVIPALTGIIVAHLTIASHSTTVDDSCSGAAQPGHAASFPVEMTAEY